MLNAPARSDLSQVHETDSQGFSFIHCKGESHLPFEGAGLWAWSYQLPFCHLMRKVWLVTKASLTEESIAWGWREIPRVSDICTCYLLLCNNYPNTRLSSHSSCGSGMQGCLAGWFWLRISQGCSQDIDQDYSLLKAPLGEGLHLHGRPPVSEDPLPSSLTQPLAGLRFLLAEGWKHPFLATWATPQCYSQHGSLIAPVGALLESTSDQQQTRQKSALLCPNLGNGILSLLPYSIC